MIKKAAKENILTIDIEGTNILNINVIDAVNLFTITRITCIISKWGFSKELSSLEPLPLEMFSLEPLPLEMFSLDPLPLEQCSLEPLPFEQSLMVISSINVSSTELSSIAVFS